MRRRLPKYGYLLACVFAVQAAADSGIGVFDVEVDPDGWEQVLADLGKVSKGTIDFDEDPDYGFFDFDGPLTSEGGGPVSPGVVLDNVVMDSNPARGPGGRGLFAVGPSQGWGNPSNAILTNHSGDSFDIFLTEPNHTAAVLRMLTVLGGSDVDVGFYDKQDRLIEMVTVDVEGAAGHYWGFWLKDPGVTIGRINIFDPLDGAEGVMQTTYYVPEPGSLSLLALGGLAVLRRRW